MIKLTVWGENYHERTYPPVCEIYKDGIHGEVASIFSGCEDVEVRVVTLDMDDCGLPDEVLNDTDVLIWWGHACHHTVPDELAERIQMRVLEGMGFIALHSAHYSKPFKKLMGTYCSLRWRDGDFERVWVTDPSHPIAEGIPPYFELEEEEMYGEFFDIPKPDSVVFTGWFRGGEVFRSGCCFTRGHGKIFYFQPGHETNRSFKNEYVRRIIKNAVYWAAPKNWRRFIEIPHTDVTTEERYAQGETDVI